MKPITKNTLFYGDNLNIMPEYIPDESMDLIYLNPHSTATVRLGAAEGIEREILRRMRSAWYESVWELPKK